ncbi:hypothetical protein LMG27198_25630 [Methylocystis echinoides]|uniref:Uncharacterized protein n=1 Tax=Methylocystis echinoides TaxID=29468 RepID=A0A9W6GV95_9HYPH|nr:hypothetical protein LMG27198_25630 [Methylocystis echinoides]
MDARRIVELKQAGPCPTLTPMVLRAPIFNAVAASVLVAALASVAMIFAR